MAKSLNAQIVSAKRVLVVDDDPIVCGALKMILTTNGYSVEVAEDSRAALRAFEIGRHHLIVTDYALGTMTGLDLARAVRKIFPAQPIIMISAYAESLASSNDRLAKVNLLLAKPFSVEEFNRALAAVFPSS